MHSAICLNPFFRTIKLKANDEIRQEENIKGGVNETSKQDERWVCRNVSFVSFIILNPFLGLFST